MRVDLFDFELPEDRIATRPVRPRDAARLLVVGGPGAALADRVVRDLPDLLAPGDTLVLNNTRVIPARLVGIRRRGDASARIEAMLHKREASDRWRAFVRPAKRLAIGDVVRFGEETEGACLLAGLDATVSEKSEGGEVVLKFALGGPILDENIASLGHIPLPPYIASKRPDDAEDRVDYQTVYAAEEGAVAAPTAGLHFTDELFARLAARGIDRQFVTLHVGAGTFLPVKADDTAEHRMHAEWGSVRAETAAALNETRQRGGRIVAVGTTSLRLLESATTPDGEVLPWAGDTDIFITPGYRFRAVDVLMTNFHLPRSTLFMLVSAFAGLERMQQAYAHAIADGYRFYSYGDGSLLFRQYIPDPETSR
ncbi:MULTISPECIES: tRNA preQ1(34) S-adenosylmethionine ribosyltransferase-isomerase QueA [unclassified Chelatococcus]|uniref:tRNA preQ1(34) S-adenosylmethionine ribosyltransferase-isomerase QueA n=1 Tax=unclassified Chelatococcus TaxID=2638111 RepID=UPI001BCD66C1|nr:MULTISPECIES: tRNA preQ1(34) S-adenosylmethionine ribosyltransferase-isomerase QueA [unclassified Chelatococcus]MBS7695681.1 tRNA preQ1(34) S-adenosylmethionine ribosyltransferase-isomerase QueA [Chelatococcus sp. YT9]MBX3557926.1 tRNA preQ1(34) S-adenosylmethionine ribosyltransferase-isomerase QueA [Chelatococcus sp.]